MIEMQVRCIRVLELFLLCVCDRKTERLTDWETGREGHDLKYCDKDKPH